MNKEDIAGMTVLDLRKLAREKKVPLSAGINKAEIVERIWSAMEAGEAGGDDGREEMSAESEQQSFLAEENAAEAQEEDLRDEDVREADASEPAAPERPAPAAESAEAQPQFKAAWHNPTNRYSNSRAGGYGQRAPAQRPQQGEWPPRGAAEAQSPRVSVPRGAYQQPHRFGPEAEETPAAPQPAETPVWREEAPRQGGAYGGYSARPYEAGGEESRARGYTGGYRAAAPRGGYQRTFTQPQTRPAYGQGQQPAPQADATDWVNPAECPDVSGVIDLHPDGYGFLRAASFLASARDVYVAAAQVRRFGLRSGDCVSGKLKPQRDGEKYASLLTVAAVNDVPADVLGERVSFDDDIERLGADYPQRRFRLDAGNMKDMRLLDLVTPMGFGQRALLLCPPDAHRTVMLRNLANAIGTAHPEAEIIIVLFGGTPEDATRMRDHVSCRVLASTFDQPAENQLRMCDLLLEYAKRRVEMKKDVVLLVDSLTRLSKACPTAAAQQGRAAIGVINPSSLNRAKRLFGTANAFRAGGSLTVVGVMTQEAARVDEAIYEEFKGAANCILTLDSAISRAGVYPALNIAQSATRKPELMLSPAEMETLKNLRNALASAAPAEAVQQLLTMIDRVPNNTELRQKLPDWLAMMRGDGKNRA